ncbi:MAG: choline dehydrogenase [Candidatus Poriferisodalaceae bacterium]|jgi:choline dehydrogenase
MVVSDTHDVIVVGAGASGAPLAARVSEDPNRTVLVLDAGPDYSSPEDTPADLRNGHVNSEEDHDWGLDYSPTEHRPEQPLPRGRVTGGSTAVNTCIFLRGTREDHDHWADLGNTDWAWDRVLPTFVRLERDLDYGHLAHHGDAGPMTIRRYPASEMADLQQAFLATADELGYPHCPDQNDPDGWGAGPQPMNKLGQLRVSTAMTYLAPARLRPNLDIIGDRHAVRLIIENGRATGVISVDSMGVERTHLAALVVLAAGAIHTPGILLRSGIGEPNDVRRIGVEPIADAPGVGRHLADHPAMMVMCRAKDPALVARDQPMIQTILRYTAPGSSERVDLQLEQLTFAGRARDSNFGVAAVLEQVEGRGELVFESADPFAKPRIHPHFCEDQRDLARLADAMEDALRFVQSGPLGELSDGVVFPDPARVAPGPEGRQDLERLLRKYAGSGFHPCGTAHMGPVTDPTAVVDQHGRSHTVAQLVVADASIMPTVPRANTNPTSILIGETIGEWIRTRPATYGL